MDAIPARGRRPLIVTLVFTLILVVIGAAYVWIYWCDLSPLSYTFGKNLYVSSRGRAVDLRPDKITLLCAFAGVSLLMVSQLVRRLPSGSRSGPMRLLLVLGIVGVFPLGARVFAVGMAVVSLLFGLGLVALVAWGMFRYVRGRK